MGEKIICDMCNSTMKFKERVESNKPYKIRRFICACGYEKTVLAKGYKDEIVEPIRAERQVQRLYKEQERNENT